MFSWKFCSAQQLMGGEHKSVQSGQSCSCTPADSIDVSVCGAKGDALYSERQARHYKGKVFKSLQKHNLNTKK